MEEIIRISRNCLLASFSLMVLLVLAIGVSHYTSRPSLFIPPSESERRTLEESLANSNDLAAVKKVCTLFAKCQDRRSDYLGKFNEHLDGLLKGIIGSIVFLSIIFSLGYFTIYRKAKILRNESKNKL